jgi:hypothetical protein
MNTATRDVWVPFFFSLALSGIGIGVLLVTGSGDAWLPVVFCFLPMAFLFVCASNYNTRQRVILLENKDRQGSS